MSTDTDVIKQPFMNRSGKFLLPLLVVLSAVLALRMGSTDLDLAAFFSGLFGKAGYEKQHLILYSIRIPRIAGAILAGIGLSVSGVLLQSVTGNALASPNIIGVNSGAGFMTIMFLTFFPSALFIRPFIAFTGAFAATMIITAVSTKIGGTKSTVILAGIALTTILNAGISFFSLLDSDVLTLYNHFAVGGISGVQIKSLLVPAVLIALTLAASLLLSGQIDILCLGDSMALSLGVRVKTIRMLCLIGASLSAAAVVSFAGLLGFVGLVVPHIARKLCDNRTKSVLLTSSLVGSLVVILADLLGRVLFAPSELPVGIMMAFVGGPFFFVLLLKQGKEMSC